MLVFGEFDKKLFVCHACDNPICCNPHHLFLGTDAENKEDMRAKGRAATPPVRRGEANNLSKLSENDVRSIRDRLEKQVNRWGAVTAIAKEYGIAANTVRRIKKRKIWAHIE